MRKPLSLGLIGVGGFGAYHLSVLETLTREGLCKLVSVADPALSSMPELQAKFGSEGVRCHADYRELLSAADLDAAVIVTPIQLHFEMARAAIERGLYVMLEKPPVPLIQQLEELIRLDRAQRVCVNFQWIGAKGTQLLKQHVVEGALGKIRDIRVSGCWPRGDRYYHRAPWAGKLAVNGRAAFDGPATNALAHQVHNVMYLAGTKREDFGVPVEVEGELYRAREIESYDVAAIRGRFESGARFSIVLAHACAEEQRFRIEVRGENASARIVDDGARFEHGGGSLYCLENALELLERSYRQFIGYAMGECPRVDTTLRDARAYVATTNAMLLSSGGIHTVGSRWLEHCHVAGDNVVNVKGLSKLSEAAFHSARSFAALGAPWAVETFPVVLAGLTHTGLPLPHPAEIQLVPHG